MNMAAINLKSLRDFIVLCYGTNVIDDFPLPKSMINKTWKYLIKPSVLMNFGLQKEIIVPRVISKLSKKIRETLKTRIGNTFLLRCREFY